MRRAVRWCLAPLLVCAGVANGAAVAAAPPTPVPLFGTGPEVYISPTFMRPGTLVRIVGVGFRPGTRLDFSALDPTAGCGRVCPMVAHAVVGPQGVVRTGFHVQYPTGLDYTPLEIVAWHPASHPLATTTLVLSR